jgi:hypothetical protein
MRETVARMYRDPARQRPDEEGAEPEPVELEWKEEQ